MLLSLWGLWLIPFGTLVIKSGWFPRILGYLLYVAGLAYMLSCVVWIVYPNYMSVISPFLFPLYTAELGIVFWMAIFGARGAQRSVEPGP